MANMRHPVAFVSNGFAYVTGPDNPTSPASCKGFGGTRFRIRLKDGTEITTEDLWFRGETSHPDTAEFLEPKGFKGPVKIA